MLAKRRRQNDPNPVPKGLQFEWPDTSLFVLYPLGPFKHHGKVYLMHGHDLSWQLDGEASLVQALLFACWKGMFSLQGCPATALAESFFRAKKWARILREELLQSGINILPNTRGAMHPPAKAFKIYTEANVSHVNTHSPIESFRNALNRLSTLASTPHISARSDEFFGYCRNHVVQPMFQPKYFNQDSNPHSTKLSNP